MNLLLAVIQWPVRRLLHVFGYHWYGRREDKMEFTDNWDSLITTYTDTRTCSICGHQEVEKYVYH